MKTFPSDFEMQLSTYEAGSRLSYRDLAFAVFLATLLAVGACGGWALSHHPRLEPFKVLNIIGLLYDLLGLVVLSELVTRSDAWKGFVVNKLAGFLVWAHPAMAFGAVLASWLSSGASAGASNRLFLHLLFDPLLPLLVLEYKVFNPPARYAQDITARARWAGGWLLTCGVVVQLVAAVLDLLP